jgi:hypothetical protein
VALRNVNLGYTFTNGVTDKIGMGDLRLNITGENLFLQSARQGLDPQYNLGGTGAGNDFNPTRVVSVGLNATF